MSKVLWAVAFLCFVKSPASVPAAPAGWDGEAQPFSLDRFEQSTLMLNSSAAAAATQASSSMPSRVAPTPISARKKIRYSMEST
jgi:hypothetical protein